MLCSPALASPCMGVFQLCLSPFLRPSSAASAASLRVSSCSSFGMRSSRSDAIMTACGLCCVALHVGASGCLFMALVCLIARSRSHVFPTWCLFFGVLVRLRLNCVRQGGRNPFVRARLRGVRRMVFATQPLGSAQASRLDGPMLSFRGHDLFG